MVQNPRRTISSSSARKQEEAPKGYSIDPNAGPMLRFQESLPRLPVPPLSSTIAKYLESVQPHLTPAEFAKTQEAANAFEKSPLGQDLQKRLQARREEPGRKNWLSDWWNEAAYMGYRDPVVVFVSYFYVHLDDKKIRDPARRAATLIKALLPFRKLVESGEIEPEKTKAGPLCMASYKWLFNSSRYPTKPSDTAHKFDAATNNHVVFLRKNKFFEVDLTPGGRELSLTELEQQVNEVIRQAGEVKDEFPVGALTSENRDTWSDAREHLVKSPLNKASLERIESAIVVVCLDDTKPVTREDISWACWTGDGRNRFYDKHQCECRLILKLPFPEIAAHLFLCIGFLTSISSLFCSLKRMNTIIGYIAFWCIVTEQISTSFITRYSVSVVTFGSSLYKTTLNCILQECEESTCSSCYTYPHLSMRLIGVSFEY